MSSMPVRLRSISPTLIVTPTPAQSPSFEQRFVTWSNGSGRTATPEPRSEQPFAAGPHSPVLEPRGLWHLVLSAPQPPQSASEAQLPWPSLPQTSRQTPCGEH